VFTVCASMPFVNETSLLTLSVDTSVDKFPAHGAGGDCITLVVCRPLVRRLVLT